MRDTKQRWFGEGHDQGMGGTAIWLHWNVGESGLERNGQAPCSCDTDCYVVEPMIPVTPLWYFSGRKLCFLMETLRWETI